MKKKITSVSPDTDLQTVWSLIFKKNIHGLPVIDKKNKLLGIISEEDLLGKIYPEYGEFFEDLNHPRLNVFESRIKKLKHLKAKQVMNKIVFTTDKDSSIFKALAKMLMLQVRQLPVINDRKVVIGIISKGDIFDFLLQSYLLNALNNNK